MIIWELWYGTLVCDNIMPAAQAHGSLEAAIRAGKEFIHHKGA